MRLWENEINFYISYILIFSMKLVNNINNVNFTSWYFNGYFYFFR